MPSFQHLGQVLHTERNSQKLNRKISLVTRESRKNDGKQGPLKGLKKFRAGWMVAMGGGGGNGWGG